MLTLYESAASAVAPWNSVDAENDISDFERLPQQKIDFCLICPLCASDCDRCDGNRRLKRLNSGRPAKEIDSEMLREMLRLRRTNKEMCAAFGIGRTRLIEEKRKLKEELP